MHIHTRTHAHAHSHSAAGADILANQFTVRESSRTHQQIDGSQCVIGCEKRRGQLIHPIISLAVAIETDAYGNTAKGGEGGERGREEKKEVMKYCGRGVYLYMYCTNVCVCVCERESDREKRREMEAQAAAAEAQHLCLIQCVCTF